MSARITKIAAVGLSAATVGGLGIGAAQAATDSSTSTSTTTQVTPATPARDGDRPRRGLSTAQLQAIATKLGVSTEQLRAALQANRPARPTGERGDRGAGLAADLATALGVAPGRRGPTRRS
jgi:hypothetical protein